MRNRKRKNAASPGGAVGVLSQQDPATPAPPRAPSAALAPQAAVPAPPAAPPKPTSLYFVNSLVDFSVIGGVSILAYVILRLLTDGTRTPTAITLAAQLAWVVNWPHFAATNYRLYHSRENIRQYPITALFTPWLLLALLVGSVCSPDTIAPYFIKLFYWWSPYHFSGQTLGITLIYARRAGFPVGRWERFGLSTFIYGSFFVITAAAEVRNPGAAPFDYYGIKYLPVGLPAWLPTAFEYLMYAGGLLFVALAVRWSMRNQRMVPLILFVPAAAQSIWFVFGRGCLAFTEFVPFFHSLQYLLIAWAMQLKEKMDQQHLEPSGRYVCRESVRWGAINLAGGALLFFVFPYAVSRIASVPLTFATGVTIAAVQIHHFFVDGVIWKLKRKTVASPLMVNLSELIEKKVQSAKCKVKDLPSLALRADGWCLSFCILHFALCTFFLVPPSSAAASAAAAGPRVSDERLVLRTSAGDVVLVLYPDVAPQHVAQILKLVRLGVYDGTHFHRVEPGFVVQLAGAEQRRYSLTPEQKAAIHPLRAEFSDLKHERGVLTMARRDNQPDSAETSFSVVIGPPERTKHLDGQYTVFGRVERGLDVFDRMTEVPRFLPPAPPLPIVPLEVTKVEIVPESRLAGLRLEAAHDVPIPAAQLARYRDNLVQFREAAPKRAEPAAAETSFAVVSLTAAGVLLIVGLSLMSFFLGPRLAPRWLGSFALLNVLVGAFVLFAVLAPLGHEHTTIATGIFLAMTGVFKLMSRFECA